MKRRSAGGGFAGRNNASLVNKALSGITPPSVFPTSKTSGVTW
jgi:hypothetical protein